MAFVVALLVAGFGGVLLTLPPGMASDGTLEPIGVQVATIWQDAIFILVPLALATRSARPTLSDFGLVGLPARRLLIWTAGAFVGFTAFAAAWGAILGVEGSQDTLARLGADEDGTLRLTAALLVIVLAPIAEEILFRGFMYRAARNSVGPTIAAVIVGVIFGLIHLSDAEAAPLVPLLAVLGALMCVLYERTGSLAAPIALHVVNNTIAFSVADDVPDAALLGIPVGLATLTAVVLLASAPRWRRPAPS